MFYLFALQRKSAPPNPPYSLQIKLKGHTHIHRRWKLQNAAIPTKATPDTQAPKLAFRLFHCNCTHFLLFDFLGSVPGFFCWSHSGPLYVDCCHLPVVITGGGAKFGFFDLPKMIMPSSVTPWDWPPGNKNYPRIHETPVRGCLISCMVRQVLLWGPGGRSTPLFAF